MLDNQIPRNVIQEIHETKAEINYELHVIENLKENIQSVYEKGKDNMKTKIRATRIQKRVRAHQSILYDLREKLKHLETIKLLDSK